mgnify:CR=1 FL=1
MDYQINVQMLEIYNENLRDLLFDHASGEAPPKLEIRSTQESGCNVPEAAQRPVSCTDDVLEVMEMGSMNRKVGSTAMNERSSRSHSVLTVIVDGYSHVTKDKTHGCLHLVDLAGSERVGRSEATGASQNPDSLLMMFISRRSPKGSPIHQQKSELSRRCDVWLGIEECTRAIQELQAHTVVEGQLVRFVFWI